MFFVSRAVEICSVATSSVAGFPALVSAFSVSWKGGTLQICSPAPQPWNCVYIRTMWHISVCVCVFMWPQDQSERSRPLWPGCHPVLDLLSLAGQTFQRRPSDALQLNVQTVRSMNFTPEQKSLFMPEGCLTPTAV